MEILGVDLAAVQQTLSVAVTLLAIGLLVALVMIARPGETDARPAIILEPAPTPERLPSAKRGPTRRPRVCIATRAPPVLLWQRIAILVRPAVE